MRIKPLVMIALFVSHASVGVATYYAVKAQSYPRDTRFVAFGSPGDKVLDGDTAVIRGVAIHIRGIDAPELGPWAHCWAEAALAKESKESLENELIRAKWKFVDRQTDSSGKVSARFVDAKGYDLTDNLHVSGHVALTDGKWNWCGNDPKLTPQVEDEDSRKGPHLWWPSGDVYDPRAAD